MKKGDSDKLFFEIPDDNEVMVKLIKAIPFNWSWVDGDLDVPQDLVASGQAEADTGFSIERFHSIHPTIVGRYDNEKQRKKNPNFLAIIVEQKLPGFIYFDEAGYDNGIITLELAKRVAIGFIQKGYRGGLHFYKSCYDNSKYDNPARCSMIFQSWSGAPIYGKEAGDQPARIKLEWDGRYYGKEDDIVPILSACQLLNLREYEPVPTGMAIGV